MIKDVILTVYSTSQIAPAQTWAKEFFEDEPIVLVMPGQGGGDFRAKTVAWAKTGDLFKAALKELAPQYKDVEIRRRILVTFSVGWSAAEELFKFPKELEQLNAYMLLDGCHTESLDNWQVMANKAATCDALMLMAHSSIKPPFVSSTVTNSRLFNNAESNALICCNMPYFKLNVPDYVLDKKVDPKVIVSLAAAGPVAAVRKEFTTDPLINYRVCGNLIELHYDGNDRPDHVYIARETQKRLWKFMGEYYKL